MVILERKVAGLSKASLARFLLRARRSVGLRGTVDLLITSSKQMRSLNSRFRGKDQATDVLSFPAQGGGRMAGEIAISAEIAAQNAARLGHTPALEIKVLALHGVLHLAGFDHERDNGQMARKEARIREKLRLPSALIERSFVSRGRTHVPVARRRGRRTA